MKIIKNSYLLKSMFLLICLMINNVVVASDVIVSQVMDINPYGSSHPKGLAILGNEFIFTANDGITDVELWKFDGVAVSQIADIYQGSINSSYINGATVFGNEIVFFANDGVTGRELWKYDGTTASLIADIYPGGHGSVGSNKSSLTVLGNELLFTANDGVHGEELWKYDGTTVSRLTDINPGVASYNDIDSVFVQEFHAFTYPSVVFNNAFIFVATDGTEMFLWKYDGMAVTKLVSLSNIFALSDFTVFGNKLVFAASDEIIESPYDCSQMGDGQICYDHTQVNTEMWQYSNNTISRLADINVTGSSYPRNFFSYGNSLVFTASNGITGTELWQYDGTSVFQAADINPGAGSSFAFNKPFIVYGDDLLMTASDGTTGQELWKYDGTAATKIVDLNQQGYQSIFGGSLPSLFTLFQGEVFFEANDGITGNELWHYDGIEVSQVTPVNPIEGVGSRIDSIQVFNDKLLFSADDGVTGRELWQLSLVDQASDHDGDGVLDVDDNCPVVSNSNQIDLDNDAIGDVCDSSVTIAELVVNAVASSDPVKKGRKLTYQATIINQGLITADSVSLESVFDSKVRILSANVSQGSCAKITNKSSSISCALNNLAAGATATVMIEVKPLAVGDFHNTIYVATSTVEASLANNTVTVKTTVIK